MQPVYFLVLGLLSLVLGNQNPYGSYPPPPPPPPSHQINSYEQANPQDPYPSNKVPPYPSFSEDPNDPRVRPNPGYGYNQPNPYRRSPPQYHPGLPPPQSQPQHQQEGFFSRIKNTLAAASSAVINSFEGPTNQPEYLPPPPPHSSVGYSRPPPGGGGFPQQFPPSYQRGYPGPPPPPPSLPRERDHRGEARIFPSDNLPQDNGGGEDDYSSQRWSQSSPPSSPPLPQTRERYPPFYSPPLSTTAVGNNNQNNNNNNEVEDLDRARSQPPLSSFLQERRSDHYQIPPPLSPPSALPHPPQPLVVIDPFENFPNDPKVFVHEEAVVMIRKPRDFAKKKHEMKLAGPQQISFFTDFEHVLTRFRQVEEGGMLGGETLGSRELVEFAGILSPEAVRQLQQLNEEFNALEVVEDSHFEEIAARSQQIIVQQGNLHSGHVQPATKALLSKLGLREGWKETLQALATQGVPSFVFSSGFGDIVANALLLGGLSQSLPQNLRIISNFFRSAPDGTVRAFSQPVVHDRNKNLSTAERHMGMTVPSRPYAIVLGSEEDDVKMSESSSGSIKQQISVGFLELSEDFVQRLPVFLNTFDVVIIGEGNLRFVQTMIEEILQIPSSSSSRNNPNPNNNNPNKRLGLALGGITKMFSIANHNHHQNNNNNNNNDHQEETSYQPPNLPIIPPANPAFYPPPSQTSASASYPQFSSQYSSAPPPPPPSQQERGGGKQQFVDFNQFQ